MVFCKPTVMTPYTIVWFPDELCLLFHIHTFIGKMTKIGKRYWLETDHFFNESYNINTPPDSKPKDKSRLSRFEIYAAQKAFCKKPALLYTTQYPDLFVSYKEGFDFNTGKRKPSILPQDEKYNQYSSDYQKIAGKLIEDKDKNISFPH